MHLSIQQGGQSLFEGFSTVTGQISNDHGDLKIGVQMRDGRGVVQVALKLYRDEFIQVGILHRASVRASLVEIAELITSGASFRRIRERIQHWQRYWELNDQEVLDFLSQVDSPLDVLKRELALPAEHNRPVLFGFHSKELTR
jgi:hypothetical protein